MPTTRFQRMVFQDGLTHFPGGQEHKSEKQAANEGPASGHKERAGDF